MPFPILDSHVHLWPPSSANIDSHSWMHEGGPLTRPFSISDYVSVSEGCGVHGFVYVETDRRLNYEGKTESRDGVEVDVKSYAAEPLKELTFLRRMVEGNPAEGDAFSSESAGLAKGLVIWAPMDLGSAKLKEYLIEGERVAGRKTWGRVKGFRFLLQGIKDEKKFKELVRSEGFMQCLEYIEQFGWSFDIGVDQRQGGTWQLELAADMVDEIRSRGCNVVFVLNHLCKPDMEHAPPTTRHEIEAFQRWSNSIRRFALHKNVYMKLSGAFSEIGDQEQERPWKASDIAVLMRPWLDVAFETFGPKRIMFGSDWPVCNVRGPGNSTSWRHWKAVVEDILDRRHFPEEDKERIWLTTAMEAYRLDAE